MKKTAAFEKRVAAVVKQFRALAGRRNRVNTHWNNGVFERYEHPVLTREHVPPHWRFDFNPKSNPFFMERLGVNATFNPGATYINGKYVMMVRLEGYDRKSFFAVAESTSGIDRFTFRDTPIDLPERDADETNVYDMRLVQHEDGFIYGIFCTEQRDPQAAPGDLSSAVAQCGIVRTKDLERWERLPDIRTDSAQQRNIVLHPEFVQGKYAFYTRPQDAFMEAGTGGGIGWALADSIEKVVIRKQSIIDRRLYHTIKEGKNGMGPAPLKTKKGWLQLAHAVRTNADGMRYVLYLLLTDLKDPAKVIAAPGGYFMAPMGWERVGDVSDVLFCNGWACAPDGRVCIYYGASDTRIHVATSTVDRLLDYVLNTPPDPLRTRLCRDQRTALIERNYRTVGKQRLLGMLKPGGR